MGFSYDQQEFQILTMRASIAILIGAIILCAQAQEDLPNFRCPEDNGFFPDPEQCDLYYECIDNIPEAKLCPDGLLFEDGNPNQEKCDYPFNVEVATENMFRNRRRALTRNAIGQTDSSTTKTKLSAISFTIAYMARPMNYLVRPVLFSTKLKVHV